MKTINIPAGVLTRILAEHQALKRAHTSLLTGLLEIAKDPTVPQQLLDRLEAAHAESHEIIQGVSNMAQPYTPLEWDEQIQALDNALKVLNKIGDALGKIENKN